MARISSYKVAMNYQRINPIDKQQALNNVFSTTVSNQISNNNNEIEIVTTITHPSSQEKPNSQLSLNVTASITYSQESNNNNNNDKEVYNDNILNISNKVLGKRKRTESSHGSRIIYNNSNVFNINIYNSDDLANFFDNIEKLVHKK
eukprot:TRINITY_DN849_c0_g1_i1.p1 TRINITY_DN849_c0_g1~~TRINITY_DN849_c0_g1_i1.p1  ORF type:complete len:147 (-),score=28.22 TRINITY_DN849_c0_g1_i1:20-460(-)